MELFNAFEKGLPLVIDVGGGNERLIAELFKQPGGIAFADIGWPDATWHPFHVVDGEISGDGPWFVGGHEIRVAFEGEQLFEDWQNWQRYRATDEGQRYTHELARDEINRSGLLQAAA